MKFSWEVDYETRLSSFLKEKLKNEYSIKDISSSIRQQRCIVNGITEKFESYKLKIGDSIKFYPKKYIPIRFEEKQIIQEFSEYLVYNKPPYISTEDLIQLTNFHCVHRLDRDTTGCLLMAKTERASEKFKKLFAERKIDKTYHALTYGTFSKQSGCLSTKTAPVFRRQGHVLFGNVKSHLGKTTITNWKVLQSFSSTTLVECCTQTGRTHQIRLHMQTLGHPIIGDTDYGPKIQKILTFRYLLHAFKLKFICPFTDKPISFYSEDDMKLQCINNY